MYQNVYSPLPLIVLLDFQFFSASEFSYSLNALTSSEVSVSVKDSSQVRIILKFQNHFLMENIFAVFRRNARKAGSVPLRSHLDEICEKNNKSSRKELFFRFLLAYFLLKQVFSFRSFFRTFRSILPLRQLSESFSKSELMVVS